MKRDYLNVYHVILKLNIAEVPTVILAGILKEAKPRNYINAKYVLTRFLIKKYLRSMRKFMRQTTVCISIYTCYHSNNEKMLFLFIYRNTCFSANVCLMKKPGICMYVCVVTRKSEKKLHIVKKTFDEFYQKCFLQFKNVILFEFLFMHYYIKIFVSTQISLFCDRQ